MSLSSGPRPAPRPENRFDEEFWSNCAKKKLCFQRCTSCRTWRHLPRAMCASCGSDAWEWAESSGRGEIYSWTITHQAILPNFAEDVPYAVVVVELEEGVRMVSSVRGIALEDLDLGLPVKVEFEPVSDDMAVPVFGHRAR